MQIIGKILGRCHIESLIGEGSSAQVFKAFHQTLGIPVAVKVLKTSSLTTSTSDSANFQERFRREARIAARLNHPGIVRVIDFGEEMGQLYLVMEYVSGSTLLDFMRRESPFQERLALKIIGFLASALQIAHTQNIIHRDLKPSNILVTKDGQLKISDLGLAKDLAQMEMTSLQITMGTPIYMAPECFSDLKLVGPESDIYSLGIILFEMLTGYPPFTGSLNQIISGHLQGTPNFDMNYQGEFPKLSPFIKSLLLKLLEKKPENRLRSCLELKQHCHSRIAVLANTPVPKLPGHKQSHPKEHAGSTTFKSLTTLLEKRLGSNSSQYQGQKIIHTTLKDRFLIWCLLACLLLSCVLAYIFFN